MTLIEIVPAASTITSIIGIIIFTVAVLERHTDRTPEKLKELGIQV
jgi:hypothetical protein